MHHTSLLYLFYWKLDINGTFNFGFAIFLRFTKFCYTKTKELIEMKNIVGHNWPWRHRHTICRWIAAMLAICTVSVPAVTQSPSICGTFLDSSGLWICWSNVGWSIDRYRLYCGTKWYPPSLHHGSTGSRETRSLRKAITTSGDELAEELALAKEKGLVLEEAMTIYNMPLYHRLKKS